MNREHHKWYSHHLGREMEFTVHGHAGRPILVFPTSMGRYMQYEDSGMQEAVRWRLEGGEIQILALDGIDSESFYNRRVSARDRGLRHNAYERYIIHEVLNWWAERNWGVRDNLLVTGASFGAFHAVNFGFKHPDLVKKIVAMSGAYSLHFLLKGEWDQELYFNSPLDYVPNLHDHWFLSRMRNQEIILAAGSDDICLASTVRMSEELWAKAVPHWLDIWQGAWHDWPIWREMAKKFLY
jgi:esterase/lipase superfamily enzyme